MTDEKRKRMFDLSVMLARIRDLCWTLQKDPRSEQFMVQIREFSDLLDEAEARLRELEK